MLVRVGREANYGELSPTLGAAWFYSFGGPPEVEMEVTERVPSGERLTPVRLEVASGIFRWPALSTYLSAGEASDLPPKWADLWDGVGLKRVQQDQTATTWQGPGLDAGSVSLEALIDGKRYRSRGSRGSASVEFRPAEPAPVTFTMVGLFETPDTAPLSPVPGPGMPPRWCGEAMGFPALSFTPVGGGAVRPKVAQASVVLDFPTSERRPSRQDGMPVKIEHGGLPMPKIQARIEQEVGDDYVQRFQERTTYTVILSLGHGNGGWLFLSQLGGATLGPIPPRAVVEEGILYWELEWSMPTIIVQHRGRS